MKGYFDKYCPVYGIATVFQTIQTGHIHPQRNKMSLFSKETGTQNVLKSCLVPFSCRPTFRELPVAALTRSNVSFTEPELSYPIQPFAIKL